MRLIDADALIKQVGTYNPIKYTYEFGDVVTLEDINHAPTIESEPIRHGHWIHREYKVSTGDMIGYYECSECKHADWFKKDNYCRFCGAKMDEVTE